MKRAPGRAARRPGGRRAVRSGDRAVPARVTAAGLGGPKIADKRQSERFKETARELGADEGNDAFDRIVEEMGRRSVQEKKPSDAPK